MTEQQSDRWSHDHDFQLISQQGEKRSMQVLWLTAVTMVIEVVAGMRFGSMALLADGWHMGTHVAAFAIAIFAYRYARKHARNPAFSFGTGKVSVLGGFASAVALAVVAILMLLESVHRILEPQAIFFNEAIAVAVLGLVINVLSALILQGSHEDHHQHESSHGHHHDHNLKAAYMHVLADALTSVLAIIALLSGKYFGWDWMDPIMGIVGAVIITRWAYGLLRDTSPILLDGSIDQPRVAAIRATIEGNKDTRVMDIHVWEVGPGHYALILSLLAADPKSPGYYRQQLEKFSELAHFTIEVHKSPP